jgi:hypothetical protein
VASSLIHRATGCHYPALGVMVLKNHSSGDKAHPSPFLHPSTQGLSTCAACPTLVAVCLPGPFKSEEAPAVVLVQAPPHYSTSEEANCRWWGRKQPHRQPNPDACLIAREFPRKTQTLESSSWSTVVGLGQLPWGTRHAPYPGDVLARTGGFQVPNSFI